MGYEIILVFIHLDWVLLNQARVAQRVSEGEHHVPEDRTPRTLQNIKQTLLLCNQCYLLDNSILNNLFQQIAQLDNGQIIAKVASMPEWAKGLLVDYLDEKY